MKHAFITLLNMSISGGFLILIVLLFRAVFKKVPRSVVLILWAVVALRLIIPFSFGSRFSLLPGGSILPENVSDGEHYQINTGYGSIDRLLAPDHADPVQNVRDHEPGHAINPLQPGGYDPAELIPGSEVVMPGSVPADDPYEPATGAEPVPGIAPVIEETNEDPLNVLPEDREQEPAAREPLFGATKTDRIYSILFIVWLAGTAAMTGYLLISCIVLLRKTSASKKIGDQVYAADHIPTAFLFGIFRPRIYLPSGITEEAAHFVILHEKEHLRRGDHLKKILGFIILIFHWFNPLAWIAYFFFSKDLEFSCDERVIRDCSEEERLKYSETMLALSSNERLVFAHPVAFGEGNLKSRIKRVLRYRRPAASLTILTAVLAVILSACLFTHRTEEPTDHSNETENRTETESESSEQDSEPETEEPDPPYVTAEIPEMKTLSDLNAGPRPIGMYDYSKKDYVKIYQADKYRLDAYEGSTEGEYCFSASSLSDGSAAVLFLSKTDGALLKTVPLLKDNGWATGWLSLWNGKIVALQSQKEGSVGNVVLHRRVVILDDHGKAAKVLFSYDDKSGPSRVLISLDLIGSKLAFSDLPETLYSDPERLEAMEREEGTVLKGRVLKLIDLKTGDVELIHEGSPDVRTNYHVHSSTERYPNGFLYTVTEDLNFELMKNDTDQITGYRCIRQNTLYYYQFADRKAYPILQSRSEYSFDVAADTQTIKENPLWDWAAGDPNNVILYGQVSGLFAAVDLENGIEYVLDKTDDYKNDRDFGYHNPLTYYRTGDGTCVVGGSREIILGGVNLSRFSAYRVLNDDLSGEKYLPLRVAEPEDLTAFYVDRSLGAAYFYDFGKTEPALTEDEIERRKEIIHSLDFSTPGDAFTEEEKSWIREYISLVLERADVSENDRISDSVKARWQTVTKLPYEQYKTDYLFGDIRLRYDDGETAAIEYNLAYTSQPGTGGSNVNILLLKRIDGQWTTAGHAVEVMPEYGPEVYGIGTAVREAAKKHHGPLTEKEIEEGKRAAVDFIVNVRIPNLSESEREEVRSYLHAEYIPDIYDKVLETDPDFTLNGYLMIRPLPYFYVTIYADAENLPENVRNAIACCLYEYEGRLERAFWVSYDTEFHASNPGSFVNKPIVLRGESEAFLKVRHAIAESTDGELKYKLVKNAEEIAEWKPLDFSRDRSAQDGFMPIKQILSNMAFSVEYHAYSDNNTLWIADQNETWTLMLRSSFATLKIDGHEYYYYVSANEAASESFFLDLMSRWEAEME